MSLTRITLDTFNFCFTEKNYTVLKDCIGYPLYPTQNIHWEAFE